MKTKYFTIKYLPSHPFYKKETLLVANVYSVSQIFLFIFLSRFKVEQKLDFKEALYSLNITDIFSGGCDLSGITGNVKNYSYIIK